MNQSRGSQNLTDATFRTGRVLPYSRQVVFEAFATPEVLAAWWGPDGFTNTFEHFDFTAGGRWKYVMHGPNGAQFQNESIFLTVDAGSMVVIQHVSKPRYVLTITLAEMVGGTSITWVQEFEDPAVAARIRHLVEPANEQNLDRLQSVLSDGRP